MALRRRSKNKGAPYHYDFFLFGSRFQGSTGKTTLREAEREEALIKQRIRDGGLEEKKSMPMTFSEAADSWLESRRLQCRASTIVDYEMYAARLKENFSKRFVKSINADDVTRLQRKRQREGKGNRSINFETGVLGQILKRQGVWSQISDQIARLPENRDVGRALTPDEEERLLAACKASLSPALYPMVVTYMDTGLRSAELRSLKRKDLDLVWEDGLIVKGWLRVASSKTEAGEGRSILLWSRVRAALSIWLSRFPDADENSYVFPRIKVQVASKSKSEIVSYDLNKALGPPKKAWTTARRAAGVQLRLHDLRHHFITKLLENPLVAEETVRRLVGHVDPRMLERYSHVRVAVVDKAMESMDTRPTCSDPLQNPLQITQAAPDLLQ